MSVRSILDTNPNSVDFGKINPNLIPSTHPPITDSIQSWSYSGSVEGIATTQIDTQIKTIYPPPNGVLAPTAVGTVMENINFPDLSYPNIRFTCTIDVSNLLVDFGNPTPPANPPETMLMQFYLYVDDGLSPNGIQVVYPLDNLNPGTTRLSKLCPYITLKLIEKPTGGVYASFTSPAYYTGSGIISDYFPYIANVNNIKLYGAFVTNGEDTEVGTSLKLGEGAPPPGLTANQVGDIFYNITFTMSN